MNLGQAAIGGRFRVLDIAHQDAELTSRLYALGLFPGVSLQVLRRAPLGDPLQIKVGQSLLSIRKEEASSIAVEAAEVPQADALRPGIA